MNDDSFHDPRQTPASLGAAIRGGALSGTHHAISKLVSKGLIALAIAAGAWWVTDAPPASTSTPISASTSTAQAWRREVAGVFRQVERDAQFFTRHTLTDGFLDVYTDATGVRKLVRYTHDEAREFYFSEGRLVFVYEHSTFASQAGGASPEVGHRYYFRTTPRLLGRDEPTMFQWTAPGRHVVEATHAAFAPRGQALLEESRQLWNIATVADS